MRAEASVFRLAEGKKRARRGKDVTDWILIEHGGWRKDAGEDMIRGRDQRGAEAQFEKLGTKEDAWSLHLGTRRY